MNEKQLEQILTSLEVAEMMEKNHKELLRDIRRYEQQARESNLALSEFWVESTYKSEGQKRSYPCYNITRKGCEFIAHKLTGTKGTIFTARYINRFHEMEDALTKPIQNQEPELPWFIRKLDGRYAVLERDFIELTGVDIRKHKLFYRREYFTGGLDFNGFGCRDDYDPVEFRQKYGFEYGEETLLKYFYLRGVKKALLLLAGDRTVHMKPGAYEMIMDTVNQVHRGRTKALQNNSPSSATVCLPEQKALPIQINITIGDTTNASTDKK